MRSVYRRFFLCCARGYSHEQVKKSSHESETSNDVIQSSALSSGYITTNDTESGNSLPLASLVTDSIGLD